MTRGAAARATVFAVLTCAVAVGLIAVAGPAAVEAAVGLPDPGVITRVGLTSARGVRDLAASVTIGGLAVVAFMLPGSNPQRALLVDGLRRRAVAWLARASAAWAAASLAVLAFTYSDLAGRPLWDPVRRHARVGQHG